MRVFGFRQVSAAAIPEAARARPAPALTELAPRAHGLRDPRPHSGLGHALWFEAPAVAAVVAGAFFCAMPGVAEANEAEALDVARATLNPEKTRTADEQELADKLAAYVKRAHGGDYRAAFRHFDRDADGLLGREELTRAMEIMGVGNMFTHAIWADGVLERGDKNCDGKVNWPELDALTR